MLNLIEGESIDQVIEFGPGGVLCKLMRRIDKSIARKEIYDSATVNGS